MNETTALQLPWQLSLCSRQMFDIGTALVLRLLGVWRHRDMPPNIYAEISPSNIMGKKRSSTSIDQRYAEDSRATHSISRLNSTRCARNTHDHA